MKNKLLTLCALFLCSTFSLAQVYKHTDENGNVTFTDQPPSAGQAVERIHIPESNTVGPPPVINRPVEEPKPVEINYSVVIASPAQETSFPRGPGNFSVSASTRPGMQPGQTLTLLIDGEIRGEPQQSGHWSLTNVFRGAHDLVVLWKNGANEELARSEPVRVYVHRPSSNF